MTTDEVANRRKARVTSVSVDFTDESGQQSKEKRPPLWRWLSSQTAHTDPARAEAARHVKDRWALASTNPGKIDRSLAAEDSVYLLGFRALLDEYRMLFAIPEDDDSFSREVGTSGALVPFAPELCKCGRGALPGTGACERHGGQWITPQDLADVSRRLHDRLVSLGEAAVRTYQDLLDNARSEMVRLQTANAVLDRIGVGPHLNINHTGEITVSAAEMAASELAARLDQLSANALERQQLAASALGDVIDAEEVEDPLAAEA